jgi:hypothetical protein
LRLRGLIGGSGTGSHRMPMLRVGGQLDPEADAVLTAALDPLTAPHPAKPQPAGQRSDATSAPDKGWVDPKTPRRPAPRRSPHPALAPSRHRRPIRPQGHQSHPDRPDRQRTPHQRRPRLRARPGRDRELPTNRPQDRLRRLDHPRRPGQQGPTARCRAHRTPGHPPPPDRPVDPGQRLHLPRLRATTPMVRRPPRHPLGRRQTHLPTQARCSLRHPLTGVLVQIARVMSERTMVWRADETQN